MCGRYALYTDPETLMTLFELSDLPRDLVPRYNIAPTQDVPVVRAGPDGARTLAMLRWGLVPSWSEDPEAGYRMINARAETAAERPAFRGPLARRRCLLPADGFYEWARAGDRKTPHFVHRADGRPMALAGLWERWARDGREITSCAILTTGAGAPVRRIHDRMPVILAPEDHGAWLDPAVTDPHALAHLLVPCDPADLALHPVGPRVNRPGNDGPDLVEPA